MIWLLHWINRARLVLVLGMVVVMLLAVAFLFAALDLRDVCSVALVSIGCLALGGTAVWLGRRAHATLSGRKAWLRGVIDARASPVASVVPVFGFFSARRVANPALIQRVPARS